MNSISIDIVVNGVHQKCSVEPRMLLADFLRHRLNLKGTHIGCEHGICGACTVVIDGATARSCLTFAAQMDGCEIQTVEGLAADGPMTVLQEEFSRSHALQCGFCTPGFLMVVEEFLRRVPNPTEVQVMEALSGNLCRCTGYVNIVHAVTRAAQRLHV